MTIARVIFKETEMSVEMASLFEQMMQDSILKSHGYIIKSISNNNPKEAKFHRMDLEAKEKIVKMFVDKAVAIED